MKLNIKERTMPKKSESKKIREEGNIPAIVYRRGKESETIIVNGVEFTALLRKVESGHLSTTVFELSQEGSKPRKAILKDIHYDPVTYSVIHLDFEDLHENSKINVKIPIEFTGVAECVGVKLGGIVRQVIRHLKVRCFPKDMPRVFKLDIKSLGLWETKRLSDLDLPSGIQPLADLHEVAVTIAKR
jgi:large subunit ribosomal protein L25